MNNIDPIIQQMLEELKKEVLNIAGSDVKKIILFGSYARGDYDSESDVDVMILVSEENIKEYKKKFISHQTDLCIKYDKLIMPLFFSYEKFTNKSDIISLYKNVKNEGVVLYDVA